MYPQWLLKVRPSTCPSLASWASVKVLLISEYAPTTLCSLFYIHSTLTNLGDAQEEEDITPSDRGNKLAQKPQHGTVEAAPEEAPPAPAPGQLVD